MSINEIFPMRKRRSLSKTPGKNPGRSSTTSIEVRRPQQTPNRITSNSSFNECEIVWDNHSPSPTRTLLGKRKKQAISDGSSSDNNDIADMVKKLANKTGQTPQDSSLYSFWFDGQETQPVVKVTSADMKKELKTPSRPSRVLRKGRKSKNRLNKELEVLASMMKSTDNNGNTDPLIHNGHNSSNREETSLLTSTCTQQTTKEHEKIIENKEKTPTSRSKKIITTAYTTPNLFSPVSDIVGINWSDDDVDDMLSQVDISRLCDQEVVTNTQRSDVEQDGLILQNLDKNEDSFVTESWDFGDSDDLIQTVEQVEQSRDNDTSKEQSSYLTKGSQKEALQCIYSKEDIEHKRLEAKQKQQHKNKLNSLNKKEDQSKAMQVRSVYSKEDIERKRLEAKQKQSLKEQSNSSKNDQSKTMEVKCLYMKEDIECKGLEAKQKQSQREQSNTCSFNTIEDQSRKEQNKCIYSKENIVQKRLEAEQKQSHQEQSNCFNMKNDQSKPAPVKCMYSKEDIEQKRLEAKRKQTHKEQSVVLDMKKDHSKTNRVKCVYSKEDIERKKLEAQQKRKQRLALQHSRQNTRQNTCRTMR